MILGSAHTFSYNSRSNRPELRWGLRTASSTRSSSMMPDSRAPGRFPEQDAPTICIRISDEAFPPSTERS